jgi:superfamily II DNA or RNA helicase
MEVPGPKEFEYTPPQDAESLRMSRVAALRRLTRKLDIAMLPSLARIEDHAAFFQGYGLVIVDECHHVPAVSRWSIAE